MSKKFKKAMIGPMLLGMISISGIFVFVGSYADEIFYKNALLQIKNLTDKASLAAANSYNSGNSILDSENIARGISQNNRVLGVDYSAELEFSWGESEVNATLPTYLFDTFWFKFMGLNSIEANNIYSKALIYSVIDPSNPLRGSSAAPKPFCVAQGVVDSGLAEVGMELELELDLEDCYDENSSDKIFGVDLDWESENFAGADNLVEFRRVVALQESGYEESEKITTLPQLVGLVATNLANNPDSCSGSAAETNMNVYVDNVIKGFNCFLGNEDKDTCVQEPNIYITDEMDIAVCANNPNYDPTDPSSAKIIITNFIRVKIDDFSFDRTGSKADDFARFNLTVLPGVKEEVRLDY